MHGCRLSVLQKRKEMRPYNTGVLSLVLSLFSLPGNLTIIWLQICWGYLAIGISGVIIQIFMCSLPVTCLMARNMVHRMHITHNLPDESAAILLDNCGLYLIYVTLSSMPWANHLLLCRDLSGEGVFEIISDVLQSHDRKIVSAGYFSNSAFKLSCLSCCTTFCSNF